MRTTISLILLGCIVLALPSCLFGRSSKTEFHGKYVSEQKMEQLKAGASRSEALELFGEPSGKSEVHDGDDLWSWRYQKETKETGAVFLLFGSSKETTHHGTVYVRFRGGKATRVWRTEN